MTDSLNEEHKINVPDPDSDTRTLLQGTKGPYAIKDIVMKWNQFKCFYYPFCLIYMVFIICLSVVVGNVKYESHEQKLNDISCGFLLTLMFCCVHFFFTVCTIWRDCVKNIKKWEIVYNSWLDVFIVILSLSLIFFNFYWQQLIITLNLFSWLRLSWFAKKIPMLGVLILMIQQILKSFMRLLPILLMCILPFIVSFYAILDKQKNSTIEGNDTSVAKSDEKNNLLGFYNAFVGTFAMMVGELNFKDSIAEKSSGFKTSTFFVFLLFITILLMNLLTGLVVNDTSVLIKQAKKTQQELRQKTINDLENFLPKKCRKKFWRMCKFLLKYYEKCKTKLNLTFPDFLEWLELPVEDNNDTIQRNQMVKNELAKELLNQMKNLFDLQQTEVISEIQSSMSKMQDHIIHAIYAKSYNPSYYGQRSKRSNSF